MNNYEVSQLLKRNKKFALYLHSLTLSVLLLISCDSFALPNSQSNQLSESFKEIEKVLGQEPSKAFNMLVPLKQQLPQFSLKQQIRFYKVQAEIHIELLQYQLGKKSATKGLELAKQLTIPSILMADLSYAKGFALESLGDIDGAIEQYMNGLEVAESLGDQKNIATGFTNLGAIYYITEQFERSIIMLNDALTIAKKLDDEELKGFIFSELSILYSLLGQEDKSMAFNQKSYDHYKSAGKTIYAVNVLRNIGLNNLYSKKYEEAISNFKEIINFSESQVSSDILYSAYSGMAWAYMKKEDSDSEAARQYMLIAGQYIVDAERHDVPLTYALDNAYILDSMKLYDEALENLAEAEKIISASPDAYNPYSMLSVYWLRGNVYHAKKLFKEAYQAQSNYLDGYYKLREKENILAIEDIRLRYESEHADLEKQILENKNALQTIELREASVRAENQQFVVILSAIVALTFAWFLAKLIRGQRQLVKATRIDGLTGVANRRRLVQLGELYFTQSIEQNSDFSVLMVDIDDFKKINDSLGHKAGDNTLVKLADIGHSIMRKTDEFGRFGGEEFIVLLPETNREQAIDIAERLRTSIYEYSWNLPNIAKVSVSIGVASFNSHKHQEFESLIKEADVMLYSAKHQGKNKVCAQ